MEELTEKNIVPQIGMPIYDVAFGILETLTITEIRQHSSGIDYTAENSYSEALFSSTEIGSTKFLDKVIAMEAMKAAGHRPREIVEADEDYWED